MQFRVDLYRQSIQTVKLEATGWQAQTEVSPQRGLLVWIARLNQVLIKSVSCLKTSLAIRGLIVKKAKLTMKSHLSTNEWTSTRLCSSLTTSSISEKKSVRYDWCSAYQGNHKSVYLSNLLNHAQNRQIQPRNYLSRSLLSMRSNPRLEREKEKEWHWL